MTSCARDWRRTRGTLKRYASDTHHSLRFRISIDDDQHSKRDLEKLEASFSSFNALAASLNESIQSGQLDAAETGRQLAEVKEQVQGAVQLCTTEMQNRSGELVREVLESHAEQMGTVRY